jgi:hypothetical protein
MHLCGNTTMEEFPEVVFSTQSDSKQTVGLQWNTSHYITHINRVTARRRVFGGVHPGVLGPGKETMSRTIVLSQQFVSTLHKLQGREE